MTIEERIDAAISRITSGHGGMRIPAEETDPDLVLADCKVALTEVRANLTRVVGIVQTQLHPGGSPPPGDAAMLVGWICREARAEAERLRTELTEEKSAHAQTAAAFHDEEQDCEQAEAKLKAAVEARDWMLRRCDYAPPCGRCRYCACAEAISNALAAAKEKS
jgi:hypothetical protein